MSKGSIQVNLVDRAKRAFTSKEIVQYTRSYLAEQPPAKVSVEMPFIISMSGLGMRSAPVQFNLQGPDLEELRRSADALSAKLESLGGYVGIDTSYRGGNPELNLTIDRDRAASLGVPVAMVAMAVRTLVGGEKMTELAQGNDRVDVRVRLGDEDRKNAEDVTGIKVRSTWGQLVELSSLVSVSRGEGPSVIERQGRQRKVTVLADLQGKSLGQAVDEVNAAAKAVVPPNISTSFVGLGDVMKESFRDLNQALFLAVVLIYLILAAQFDSLIHPFTIMLALPLSVVGAFGALAALNIPLGLFAMIGLILLMGIVTKNGVLLVDYTNTLRKRGMSRDEALLAAGPVRLRPILMTSVATIIGMVPVALGRSLGGEVRAPMAIAVIGGLITSTVLTLLVVPVVYSLLDRFSARKRVLSEEPAAAGPAPAALPGGA